MKRSLPLFFICGILQCLTLCAQTGQVSVYTTADNTGLRLTKTSDTARFYRVGQPRKPKFV